MATHMKSPLAVTRQNHRGSKNIYGQFEPAGPESEGKKAAYVIRCCRSISRAVQEVSNSYELNRQLSSQWNLNPWNHDVCLKWKAPRRWKHTGRRLACDTVALYTAPLPYASHTRIIAQQDCAFERATISKRGTGRAGVSPECRFQCGFYPWHSYGDYGLPISERVPTNTGVHR